MPALVYAIGQDARSATTSSLFIVGVSSVVGALGHARSGQVRWGTGLVFGATGIAAGFAGTAANEAVDPDVLLLAFAGLIVVTAVAMIVKTRSSRTRRHERPCRRRCGRPAVCRSRRRRRAGRF